jgi:uncharacterized protein (DUF305 family)
MKYLLATLLIIFFAACKNNPDSVNSNEKIDNVRVATPLVDSFEKDKIKIQNPLLESMMLTMKKMDTLKISNDFDLNFANTMLIHHQAAIDMSAVEIANGKNAEIVNMAKNITNTQKEEIAQLKIFVNNYKLPFYKIENKNSKTILADVMKNMMQNINDIKLLDRIDDDFVMLMIAHHNAAIQMAKDEITFGKEKQIITLAQKILATQTAEVNKFVAWNKK